MIDAYFNALDEAQSLELVFDDKAISELAPYFIDNKSITNISGSFYIYGTAVNDTLHSDNEDARIFAKAGNDILVSGNGHDELYAGSGDDMVTAGAGDDFVYGETGSDHVYAGIGNDNVYLDEGDDIAYGNEDNDEIYGQTGKDSLYGGAGEDMLDGGIGDDELYGGTSHDNLFGAEGNDILNGEADDDYLSGNLGHDTYIFSGVFGYDVIADFGNIADKDILLFKDLKLDEVSFSLNGTNLLLTDMTREGNYVEIVDYVTNQENYIEQFTFIDYQVAILVDYKNSFDNQININLI
nr:calcium-binding protein [Actinobacillus suis]